MAEIEFIEKAAELGIKITEPEIKIIADELAIMTAGMEVTKEIFQLKLTQLITSLESRGMSAEQVINVLIDDLENNGAIFGGLKRQLIGDAQGFAQVTNSRLTTTNFEQQSGEASGTWIAVLVNTCEDCLPRHGITKTYKEWDVLGWPKSGFSVCGKNCLCDILPASIAESKTELQEPLKRAKGKLTAIARKKKKDGQIKSIPKYVNRNLGTINSPDSPLSKGPKK